MCSFLNTVTTFHLWVCLWCLCIWCVSACLAKFEDKCDSNMLLSPFSNIQKKKIAEYTKYNAKLIQNKRTLPPSVTPRGRLVQEEYMKHAVVLLGWTLTSIRTTCKFWELLGSKSYHELASHNIFFSKVYILCLLTHTHTRMNIYIYIYN